MKKLVFRLLGIAVAAAAIWGVYGLFQQLPQREQRIPTTRVRQGDIVIRTYARGELQAVRTAPLTAPNLFGTVQVVRLAPLGSLARVGDLIVQFDDAEVLGRIEQRQLEIDQIQQQIIQSRASLEIRNNQDEVELLQARYSVRRAELEVKRNEIVSPIDAKKNMLNLEEAQRRLKQLESDIVSRREQAKAELAVLEERLRRAQVELQREQARLNQVKLLAPMSGLVSIKENRAGFSGMMGTAVPDIREGDQVQPGVVVAEILDLSELEILSRVGELDRANLREGQDVVIRLDALPDKKFNGKIKSMSSTARANIFSSDPAKKFDVVFSIDMRQLLSALGAKPEQIERILRTAEENRKRPPVASGGSFGGMFNGGAAGLAAMMQGGAVQGGFSPAEMMARVGGPSGRVSQGAGEGSERSGAVRAPGMRMLANLPEEDRKKVQAEMEKILKGRSMQDLSPEERTALFAKLRESFPNMMQGGRRGGEQNATGTRGQAAPPGTTGGGAVAGSPAFGFVAPFGGQRFTKEQLDNAKLPPPPEEDSELDVLLRPGLLADVEIIVENIPNAIHIPTQALFEKDGQPVVYVRSGETFVARPVRIARQSESTTIIAAGLQRDEIIALVNPEAKPGETTSGSSKKAGSGAPVKGLGGKVGE